MLLKAQVHDFRQIYGFARTSRSKKNTPEGLACPELLLGRAYASKIFYRFVSIIALFVEIFEFYNPNSSFRNPLVFDFCLRFTVSLNYMKHQPVSSSIELVPLVFVKPKIFQWMFQVAQCKNQTNDLKKIIKIFLKSDRLQKIL